MLKALNKLFPLPQHPFNMQAEGEKTYAEWQYEKGDQTIKFYLEYTDIDTMFRGRTVLDIGCGAGGKSLYYLSQGAEKVVGIDIVPHYKEEAEALAAKLGLEGFTFMVQDAAATDFADDTFDTIIANDAMEHVARPEAVLKEIHRILKPGGRFYVNFPPYNHPFGAHLSDVIGMPWVQVFFSDKTLIAAYKELVADKPDGADRIAFRFSTDENGEEYYSYINRMTIKRFRRILADTDLPHIYYREVPLRPYLAWLNKIGLREYFTRMVVCVFEKK